MPRCACTPTSFGLSSKGKPFDPCLSYITSPCFSPRTLALLRLTMAFYALVTIVVDLVWSGVNDKDVNGWFSYFTHLSYVGLCAYFFAAGVQTHIYAKKDVYKLRWWPRFFHFLHVLLYATISTFPFVVTIVFWTLLASPSTFNTPFLSWSNISMHAMNSGFVLFEILLTNLPPAPWAHLPICVLFLGGYLGVAYVTSATQHFYTYSFLDPKKQGALLAAYIVGIAAGECIVYAVVYAIVLLRVKLTRRYSALANSDFDMDENKESLSEWEQISRPSV